MLYRVVASVIDGPIYTGWVEADNPLQATLIAFMIPDQMSSAAWPKLLEVHVNSFSVEPQLRASGDTTTANTAGTSTTQ